MAMRIRIRLWSFGLVRNYLIVEKVDDWFEFIIADIEEKEVKCIDSSLSPPEKVQHAIDCLPISLEKKSSFFRWTIMDYSKAYRSGDITPLLVFCLSSFLLHGSLMKTLHACIDFWYWESCGVWKRCREESKSTSPSFF